MKLIVLAATLSFSLVSLASDIPAQCFIKATKAVEKSTTTGGYDTNGVETLECKLADNKAVYLCQVAASKGDGAAMDSYLVVLTKTCSKALRLELSSEE